MQVLVIISGKYLLFLETNSPRAKCAVLLRHAPQTVNFWCLRFCIFSASRAPQKRQNLVIWAFSGLLVEGGQRVREYKGRRCNGMQGLKRCNVRDAGRRRICSTQFQGLTVPISRTNAREKQSGAKKRGFLEGGFCRMYASLGCGALSAKCTAGANILAIFCFLGRDTGLPRNPLC